MLSERIESINENENISLFGINMSFTYNGYYVENLNNTSFNLNNSISINKDIDSLNSYFLPYPLNIKSNEVKFIEIPTKLNNNGGPLLYSYDNILNIFMREENKIKFNDIINQFYEKKANEQMFLLEKKRKRNVYYEKYRYIFELIDKEKQNEYKIIENENINNNKRGRKTNKTKYIDVHDKMVQDNIIKKIKAKIFEYPIIFLNNILDNNNKAKYKLFKLDYKYINRLNREQDLKYLDMSLKELFSKDISPKYISNKRDKNFNKKYIDKILKNQKDNTILFVFNITFRDWLDLFTLKKNINEIIKKYNYKDIDCDKIQRNINGVDNLLKKIMNENDKEYLTNFIFLLYNYERWFYNRIGRKSKYSRNVRKFYIEYKI